MHRILFPVFVLTMVALMGSSCSDAFAAEEKDMPEVAQTAQVEMVPKSEYDDLKERLQALEAKEADREKQIKEAAQKAEQAEAEKAKEGSPPALDVTDATDTDCADTETIEKIIAAGYPESQMDDYGAFENCLNAEEMYKSFFCRLKHDGKTYNVNYYDPEHEQPSRRNALRCRAWVDGELQTAVDDDYDGCVDKGSSKHGEDSESLDDAEKGHYQVLYNECIEAAAAELL